MTAGEEEGSRPGVLTCVPACPSRSPGRTAVTAPESAVPPRSPELQRVGRVDHPRLPSPDPHLEAAQTCVGLGARRSCRPSLASLDFIWKEEPFRQMRVMTKIVL